MAVYCLECKKCGHQYEIMSMMSEKDKNVKKAKCPECKSKKKTSLISNIQFMFSNPEGTDRYANSHDYRFRHQMDKPGGVRDQRKTAEKSSHVGPTPYREIDDISSGKNFGSVK
jgi:putative FmdB family regulatory protein